MGSILGVLLLGGTGCTTLGWYGQAMRGQLELMTQREDIETRLAAPGGDPVEQRKLALALEARVFAHDHLALPDNGSYRRYVDLDREAVLWNVVAAPEFSLEPRLWCYPLVGCLAASARLRRPRRPGRCLLDAGALQGPGNQTDAGLAAARTGRADLS
jgi:predicted aminopeptidase